MKGVVDWIYDRQWAITEEALRTIIAIAESSLHAEVRVRDELKAQGVNVEIEPFAQTVLNGTPLEGAHNAALVGDTAVIPVIGPIFPRANLMTMLSGATSAQIVQADFETALASKDVKRILFDIDSPGGEVTGTSDLATAIFEARGEKPIVAFARGMMASGAYWIGSSADEVLVSDTARVGSIGVVGTYLDTTKKDETDGVKRIEFVSSVSPNKHPDVHSDEGKAQYQNRVDSLAEVFVGAMARNRGTSVETVLEDFGKGGVFVGALAVGQGLADDVSTVGRVLGSSPNTSSAQTTSRGGRAMTRREGDDDTVVTMTPEAIRESSPDAHKTIHDGGKAEGTKEGAEAERERIKAIDAIKAPGCESIIAEAKYDPEMTADKVATKILAAQEAKRDEKGTEAAADAKELGTKAADAGSSAAAATPESEAAKAEVDATAAKAVEGANEGTGRVKPVAAT